MKFLGWEKGVAPPSLRNLFDDFCDSSVLGMRYVFSTTAIRGKTSNPRFSSLIRSLPTPSSPFSKFQKLNGVSYS